MRDTSFLLPKDEILKIDQKSSKFFTAFKNDDFNGWKCFHYNQEVSPLMLPKKHFLRLFLRLFSKHQIKKMTI